MPANAELPFGDQIPGGRDYQEDAFQVLSTPKGVLLVLADGMGGHVGGARASELAVATFVARFEKLESTVADCMREALEAANMAIAEEAASDPRLSEMGCTLVACLIDADQAYWISVGDSPLWCLRDGELIRLNEDHSMKPLLQDMVALGRMSEQEMLEDPRVNQLRSALIGEELPLIDQNEQPFVLQADDRLLLASDGLESLDETQIAELTAVHESPSKTVASLLAAIEDLARPGQDNTTALVYRHEHAGWVQGRVDQMEASTLKRNQGRPSVSDTPAAEPEQADAPNQEANRKGLFSRLFGR